MGRIDFNKVFKLMVPSNKDKLSDIILSYATISKKLEKFDEQSWYFRKAVKMHESSRDRLHNQFQRIRESFYELTVDDLLEEIKINEDKVIKTRNSGGSRMMAHLTINHYTSRIRYAEYIMTIKSRVDEVHDIDFYINNPDEFRTLVGW